MFEIGSGLDGHPSTQPSRFKRLTMNFNLLQEPDLTNQESSEQSFSAKLCKFSLRAASGESDYGVMTNFRVEGVVYGRQVEGK